MKNTVEVKYKNDGYFEMHNIFCNGSLIESYCKDGTSCTYEQAMNTAQRLARALKCEVSDLTTEVDRTHKLIEEIEKKAVA